LQVRILRPPFALRARYGEPRVTKPKPEAVTGVPQSDPPPPSPPASHAAPVTAQRSQDSALAARLRVGDAGAFEEIVLAYAQPLTAFAWRYLRSEEEALDLVQDVFADLWMRRHEMVIKGSVRAYLMATVRNRAINSIEHARVEARWREAAGGESTIPLTTTPAPSDERAERAELAAAVTEALRSLPPRAQEIARLRWLDRLSKREIADVLGIAVATVSVHLTRAVKRLRPLLRRFRP
jgi:RNA polymerase sigma-70 factor (family 1)